MVFIDRAAWGPARFPHAVRRLLLRTLALRDRRDGGELGDHGLRVALGRVEAATDRLLAGRVTYPPNRRLLQHLRTERPALFTCVRRADVEATNWQAEQAIRPAVVTRKVCGGNRSPRGAATQEIVASVLRTSVQQHRDPLVLLAYPLGTDDHLGWIDARIATDAALAASDARRFTAWMESSGSAPEVVWVVAPRIQGTPQLIERK